MASKNNSKAHPLIVLFIAAACYLSMAIAGMHFGLPDSGHNLSYNCDELNYIEVLSRLKPSEGKINPHPFFTHPTGYLLMNGTALLAMRAVGWIPKGDQEFFRLNPYLFARFYLVGRTLQVFFGLALLIAGWFVFRKIWGDSVASYTLLLLAVSPSFVATSHFSQANMPVALFMFFALAALWFGVSKGFAEKWLYFASYLNGLAISIKVSALAFFAPIA